MSDKKPYIPSPPVRPQWEGDAPRSSAVNHPSHYNQVPGIECINVVEHFDFLRGNAIKYLWRAGSKGNLIQDLEKAKWYIDREIARERERTTDK